MIGFTCMLVAEAWFSGWVKFQRQSSMFQINVHTELIITKIQIFDG